jgi:putative oxidoreductase
MKLPHYSKVYETWAPVIARVVFGGVFLMSAYFKIPGTEMFSMQVGMSEAVGIPFAYAAVVLAFILEVVAGVALIIGWQVRTFALLLAGFVMLIALFFYRNLADQATFALFMNCLTLTAGLIYVSVYGAQTIAVKKDPLPQQG